MSLASDYAANQAAVSAPNSFIGPNGRAEVTPSGGLRLVPTTMGNFEIPAAAALAFAAWINATFG